MRLEDKMSDSDVYLAMKPRTYGRTDPRSEAKRYVECPHHRRYVRLDS